MWCCAALRDSAVPVMADIQEPGDVEDVHVPGVELAGGEGPLELGDRHAHFALHLAFEVRGPLLRVKRTIGARPSRGELWSGSTQRLSPKGGLWPGSRAWQRWSCASSSWPWAQDIDGRGRWKKKPGPVWTPLSRQRR